MSVRVGQALKQKSAIWLGVAVLAVLLALLLAVRVAAGQANARGSDSANLLSGERIARAVANLPGADRIGRLLDRRSPGERVKGELVKTKAKAAPRKIVRKRALPKRAPRQRALGKIVMPAEVFPDFAFAGDSSPLVPTGGFNSFGPFDFGTGPILAAATTPSGPIGVLVVPGAGNGGGSVTPPEVPINPPVVTPTTPPVAAIPEPATWAMMLAGFALIGLVLRRRPRPLLARSEICAAS